MIKLKNDSLTFSFPKIHKDAKLTVSFQRTLRIPDDENTYPLPPGLGNFPLRHVDDYSVPSKWVEHGGVMMPMYQSEAMWINFNSHFIEDRGTGYPFAIKIATGKINAVTGESWQNRLIQDPQDYMVSTEQPWIDGYCVDKDTIRQFVAMPLGSGYSAEEQISEKAEHGGLQIIVYPMKRDVFDKRFPKIKFHEGTMFSVAAPAMAGELCENSDFDMGLAPGGKMRQEIYEDPFDFSDWERGTMSRCFIHIANSLVWRAITGKKPPTVPFTAKEYTNSGLPWFEYYNDKTPAVDGSSILKQMKSIIKKAKEKKDNPLPENESVKPDNIKIINKQDQVREGVF